MPFAGLLPRTIRGQFALFALSLALPLVALIGYGLYDRARDEFAAAEDQAQSLAESNADRAAEYVAGLRGTLEALSRRPLVRAMDTARCDPRLGELVELYPRAASLIVVDPEGAILCSSNPLPRDRVVRVVDLELLAQMRAVPRLLVSKPVRNRFDGRWIVSAVQPVTGENGALIGTVAMATDLLRWRPFPPAEALPAGAIVTIVTSDGTIIARSAEAAKWISRKVWDERLVKSILESKEGVVHARGPDGTERIFGVSSVAGLPWFVLAGLPEESVFAAARGRLVQTGVLLALIVAIVIALAWVFVTRLSKPIRAIAEAVAARAEGDEGARIPVAGPLEVAEVARELNRTIEIRARKERELSESEARYRFLFDNMLEGFAYCRMVFDNGQPRDFVYISVNRAFEELTGLKNVVGKSVTEVIPGIRESNPEMFEIYAGVVRTGVPASFETRVDPLGIWFSISAYRPQDGHFVAVFNNITGRKHAEEGIRQLNVELEQRVADRTAQLEAANKELEAFSYSVSHDLRAPLRAIDGFSRIVHEDYHDKLDDEGRRLLGVIRDNSQKMGQLIDDLLEYSRLGRKPLSSDAIDMKRLVEEVIGELQASGEPPHGLVLAALPPARGDATLLKQVWTNLLTNAIKFSGKRAQSVIGVSGNENGAEIVYCVKDNGAGFDMRYHEKLFKVFQRLHREEEFEGTGVGLAIVQRVVSRHGGRVWAEGTVDEGAAFYFALPKRGGA